MTAEPFDIPEINPLSVIQKVNHWIEAVETSESKAERIQNEMAALKRELESLLDKIEAARSQLDKMTIPSPTQEIQGTLKTHGPAQVLSKIQKRVFCAVI